MKKNNLLVLEKLLSLEKSIPKRFGWWLINHLSYSIEHLQDKKELIYRVFKKCILLIFMIKKSKVFKNKILTILEYPEKKNWIQFLDKLNTSEDHNILSMLLLKILLQELISKEKVYQPFWNSSYKTISDKLILPIKTDINLSNPWSIKQEEKLQFLIIQKKKLEKDNLTNISYQSFMSSHIKNFDKEVILQEKIKTIQIKIFPTMKQKVFIDEFINTYRYVYNKSIEYLKKGHKPNFQDLRDLLVTENTKKGYKEYSEKTEEINNLRKQKNDDNNILIDEQIKQKNKELRDYMKNFEYIKNPLIKDFELNTPKDIRSNAVQAMCDGFKSSLTNFKKGNIKFFYMKFKKKDKSYGMFELTPKNISMKKGTIKILPQFFKDDCILKISKKNHKKYKNLLIKNNTDIIKKNGNYYINIIDNTKLQDKTTIKTICGVDPGLRTLATVYSTNNNETTITEYLHRKDLLIKLNKKIDLLKNIKIYYRKKQYNKIELKKKNIIDSIHWELINDLLKNNDVIYFGDIKSHNIVKGKKNHTLNRDINDIKFFVLKQRLKYKASLYQKNVYFIHEAYTTKTCSNCGIINEHIGCKEIFKCDCCKMITGRDENASKNILMKGLLS